MDHVSKSVYVSVGKNFLSPKKRMFCWGGGNDGVVPIYDYFVGMEEKR